MPANSESEPAAKTVVTDVRIDLSDTQRAASGLGESSCSIATQASIETQGLSKTFGDFEALSDCTLKIAAGQTFGLLGPNGAGKSTLLRLMLGFLQPTAGKCWIGSVDTIEDSIAARSKVSYLPGDARLPRHMRGKHALRHFAELHPDGDLRRSHKVAETLELDLNRYVGFMSTGMRQKLALAIVLGPRTPVLILDEPTANLDPTVRNLVLDFVDEASDEGRTVVFSSHVMSEIEQTCDQVAFLRRGRLAGQLVMTDLAQRHKITGVIEGDGRQQSLLDSGQHPLTQIPDTTFRLQGDVDSGEADRARIDIETGSDLALLLPWLQQSNVRDLRIEPVGLNTVYEAVHRGDAIPSLIPTSNDQENVGNAGAET